MQAAQQVMDKEWGSSQFGVKDPVGGLAAASQEQQQQHQPIKDEKDSEKAEEEEETETSQARIGSILHNTPLPMMMSRMSIRTRKKKYKDAADQGSSHSNLVAESLFQAIENHAVSNKEVISVPYFRELEPFIQTSADYKRKMADHERPKMLPLFAKIATSTRKTIWRDWVRCCETVIHCFDWVPSWWTMWCVRSHPVYVFPMGGHCRPRQRRWNP